ncbi:hypothetical protein IHE45_04G126600 [Dioscorea alata]|uniref:Uncharacterized protein n=1 Tax=Dioscorea alata TaxID=55571 RepID=A0ACB7WFP1_DIOAL|nr:hypothetical protein IHE45_04G126600 [Dioscorea alata]
MLEMSVTFMHGPPSLITRHFTFLASQNVNQTENPKPVRAPSGYLQNERVYKTKQEPFRSMPPNQKASHSRARILFWPPWLLELLPTPTLPLFSTTGLVSRSLSSACIFPLVLMVSSFINTRIRS